MKQKIYLLLAVVIMALLTITEMKAQNCVIGTNAYGPYYQLGNAPFGQSFKPGCSGKITDFFFRSCRKHCLVSETMFKSIW